MGRGAWGLVTIAVIAAVVTAGLGRIGTARPRIARRTNHLTPYGLAHPAAATQTATFAAGCFWKLEDAMRHMEGVVSTTAGYTGGPESGTNADPAHASVSAGRTGHAEAVLVTYDTAAVSYEKLLETFWSSHDPMNFAPEPADDPDRAPPGRSIIFYHSPVQRFAAETSRQRLQASGKYPRDIPTEVLPATTFHHAEDEHQQFLEKHGESGATCRMH